MGVINQLVLNDAFWDFKIRGKGLYGFCSGKHNVPDQLLVSWRFGSLKVWQRCFHMSCGFLKNKVQ